VTWRTASSTNLPRRRSPNTGESEKRGVRKRSKSWSDRSGPRTGIVRRIRGHPLAKSAGSDFVPERGDIVWMSFDPQAGHEHAVNIGATVPPRHPGAAQTAEGSQNATTGALWLRSSSPRSFGVYAPSG
jgi:hypothetical protein